ncbi:hypothetical protein FACS1894111_03330 [Clostridia bacterium]|nr:hypothetical protein FACS1894111_03330 [Clostridia bacterium]
MSTAYSDYCLFGEGDKAHGTLLGAWDHCYCKQGDEVRRSDSAVSPWSVSGRLCFGQIQEMICNEQTNDV